LLRAEPLLWHGRVQVRRGAQPVMTEGRRVDCMGVSMVELLMMDVVWMMER
jgi:hypothetical protein